MSHVRGWHLPFYRLLPTGPTLRQMNSKQAQLQLMGWIGSLPSVCWGKTSAHLLLRFDAAGDAFGSLDSERCLDGWKTRHVVWGSQSVGTAPSDWPDIGRAWSQAALSAALIWQKHRQPKQWLATSLIAQTTSWYNYTIRKLTRHCVCSRHMFPALYVTQTGSHREREGEELNCPAAQSWPRFYTTTFWITVKSCLVFFLHTSGFIRLIWCQYSRCVWLTSTSRWACLIRNTQVNWVTGFSHRVRTEYRETVTLTFCILNLLNFTVEEPTW